MSHHGRVRFRDNRVPITVNTDGTHLLRTNILQELLLLYENKILDEREINEVVAHSRKASFLG